jgi:hypothetical protein
MKMDWFIFETLFGMRRSLHFSLLPKANRALDLKALRKYRTDHEHSNGTMWTAAPHHLLVPSFCFAFHVEAAGVHDAMGVNLDDVFTAAASVLFYIPLLRDLVITLGGRIASPTVLSKMKIFALAPGGIHEMIRQGPETDRIFLRTGFLRFAIKKKLDINVIYLFDENECYKPISGLPKFVVTAQRWVHRTIGAGFSIWKGRWGIPFNPIPYPVPYVTAVGRPILIKQVEGMEEDAAIEFLMDLYIKELKRLFKELQEDTGRRQHVTLEIERLQSRVDRGVVVKKKSKKAD